MFNTTVPTTNTKMFLDPAGAVGVARYDRVKYPQFTKLFKRQNGFFWQPGEINCDRDAKDFRRFTDVAQHIFTSNIKRQIVLDTKQGRAIAAILAPITSLPELDVFAQAWNYFEVIHGMSYTHIIQSIYPNPTEILDSVLDIEPVMACLDSISDPYDRLEYQNTLAKAVEFGLVPADQYSVYEHKKALWLCINAINALEGIRFYVSFACSWAFAELKQMEGNAKIIKLIARDENLHLAASQQIIKLLPLDDPDFAKIQKECLDDVQKIFTDVVDQEITWAEYLFKDGSMIGLNAELLASYVKWIANKRMTAIGIETPFPGGSNPLPWTQKWISGSDVQVAPQQVQVSSYVIAGYTKDISADTFSNFEL